MKVVVEPGLSEPKKIRNNVHDMGANDKVLIHTPAILYCITYYSDSPSQLILILMFLIITLQVTAMME